MKIGYVQSKKISHDRIASLLNESTEVNQFSNNGPLKRKLEGLLQKKLGLTQDKRVVCVNNGTSACHVIMFFYQKNSRSRLTWSSPSLTFPTVVVNGSNTKLFDIETVNYTLPLTEKVFETDGVILTNLFGTFPGNIETWIEECSRRGKKLIFDNASSPMTNINGSSITSFGDMSFGSLHHTKYLGFGEGGFIVCNAEDYDEVDRITNFGFDINKKFQKLSSNFKMSEVMAAYIIAHVESYDIGRHIKIQKHVTGEIARLGKFKVFSPHDSYQKECNVVLGNLPITPQFKTEKDLMATLRSLGIETNKYYKPLVASHRNSQQTYGSMLNLPLNESITDYQVEYMTKVLKAI